MNQPNIPSATDLQTTRENLDRMAMSIPFPIRIYNDDGTLNLTNIVRVLQGKEFEDWRSQPENQQLLANMKTDFGLDISKKGLGILPGVASAIFGAGQIAQAKKIDTTMPKYPTAPGINPNTAQAVGMAGGRATRGMSAEERLNYERAVNQARASQLNTVQQESGGQGAMLASAANAVGSKTADDYSKINAMDQQVRRQNFNDYLNAIAPEVQQQQFQTQVQQDAFRNSALPQWQQRVVDHSSLMGAGQQNVIGGFNYLNQAGQNILDTFFTGRPDDLSSSGNVYLDQIKSSAQKMLGARNAIGDQVIQALNISPNQDNAYVTDPYTEKPNQVKLGNNLTNYNW